MRGKERAREGDREREREDRRQGDRETTREREPRNVSTMNVYSAGSEIVAPVDWLPEM